MMILARHRLEASFLASTNSLGDSRTKCTPRDTTLLSETHHGNDRGAASLVTVIVAHNSGDDAHDYKGKEEEANDTSTRLYRPLLFRFNFSVGSINSYHLPFFSHRFSSVHSLYGSCFGDQSHSSTDGGFPSGLELLPLATKTQRHH